MILQSDSKRVVVVFLECQDPNSMDVDMCLYSVWMILMFKHAGILGIINTNLA